MATAEPTTAPAQRRTLWRWTLAMPRWKKVLLLAATAAAVTGGAMMLAAPTGGADPAGGTAGLAANLLPGEPRIGGDPGSGTGQPAAAGEPAAKGVFRLGFSFVAGFCLGAFVRATLRVASIAVGFWLAMTLLLSYYGLVVVDWTAIDGLWQRFCANVESEWADFRQFVTGSLPAAGLAVAGLAVGLKRH